MMSDADRLAYAWKQLKNAIILRLSSIMLPMVQTLERWLTRSR